MTQMFLSFFHNFCLFVGRHSDLEGLFFNFNVTIYVNLVAWGHSGSRYLSDIGLHDLKHVWNGIFEGMMGVLGR
jgi:hypothetical protein